eukprot:scaffold15119_cov63-Cyclotella_meneghiniana.AAC.2
MVLAGVDGFDGVDVFRSISNRLFRLVSMKLFLSLEDSRFLFIIDTQQSVSVVFSDILYEG